MRTTEDAQTADTTFKVSLIVAITAQNLEDILVTAFEGGITYWADTVHVPQNKTNDAIPWHYASDLVAHGGSVQILYQNSNEQLESQTLTRPKLLKGWEMFFMQHGYNLDNLMDFDAHDADCIVQYALFQKLVFG